MTTLADIPRKTLPASALPPLENGERMHAAEFLRRYEAMPGVKKAELIEGVVHMPSPVRYDTHGKPDGLIHAWLCAYAMSRAELDFVPNPTYRLDSAQVYQPDAVLCSLPKPGGRTWLDDDGFLRGSPELVCEVAGSSKHMDLFEKKEAYLRAGVPEYLVWRTRDGAIDWFIERDDEYVLLAPDAQGKIASVVFPGLVLDIPAALRGDRAALAAALR